MVILPNEVNASNLRRQGYWTHQTIDNVREFVELKNDKLYIELDATINVDNTIHNESDWVTFIFSPTLYNEDQINSFNSSVSLQTSKWGGGDVFTPNSKANYTISREENSYFVYNVSLKNLKGRNTIIFNAKYTINNRVFRTGDYTHGFFYHSRIDEGIQNHNIYFRFPNNVEVTYIRGGCVLGYGPKFQDCSVRGKEADSVINFVFKDKDEEKQIKAIEKSQERKFNFILTIMSIFAGALITLMIENIFYKKKILFGGIEVKKFKKFQKIIIKIFKK